MSNKDVNLAFFVTPHGFGHASRASAVMNALYIQHPDLHFHVFTSIPEWFFTSSLTGNFSYYSTITDIGVVQTSAFEIDLSQTLDQLEDFFPLSVKKIIALGEIVKEKGCLAILSDIAALGIQVANHIKLPSFLVENFTWDWIYEPYLDYSGKFKAIIDYLKMLYSSAIWHIQAEPFCNPEKPAHLRVFPVSRSVRTPAEEIRQSLQIEPRKKLILYSIGGFGKVTSFPIAVELQKDYVFLIPGNYDTLHRKGNIIELPFKSDFYYPDLINAADLVIGKAGYSTIAEIYQSGTPLIVIKRDDFREAWILEEYAVNQLNSILLDHDHFLRGDWLPTAEDLLKQDKQKRQTINGARQIAEFVTRELPIPL